MSVQLPVKLIVAHDSARGIGLHGAIPWFIPGEMKWVSEVTRQTADPGKRNALIMGRFTYLSIPLTRRPLFGRANIVVSSHWRPEPGALVAPDLDAALEAAARLGDIETVFVFGGESLYRQSLDAKIPDELLVTVVEADHACDRFFPPVPDVYAITSAERVAYGDTLVRRDTYTRT